MLGVQHQPAQVNEETTNVLIKYRHAGRCLRCGRTYKNRSVHMITCVELGGES